jgi:cob(I)alamin adenosyltransferase
MARRITWNGTTDEALALLHALRTHCECRVEFEHILTPCASHLMLACDQRAVDGLLFMRRMAARLLAEEFGLAEDFQPAGETSVPV